MWSVAVAVMRKGPYELKACNVNAIQVLVGFRTQMLEWWVGIGLIMK